MDLKSFLKNYPDVHVAKEGDEARLREFFHRVPMRGEGMQLQYLRNPNFFDLLKCHSSNYVVVFVQNDQGVVEGAGTFVFRPAMVDGKRETIAYLGDLRVDNIRRWGRYWRTFYLDLMKNAFEIEEFQKCHIYLTAIMNQNAKAKKALGESSIGYHHFHDYKMVNVLRAWRPVCKKLKARSWDEIDADELNKFHREANQFKPLGWVFDDTYNEIEWRTHHWKGFKLQDGIALYDEKGIAVSGAFWSPSEVKKIVVQKVPNKLRHLYSLMRLIVNLPHEGAELKCLYLTMLDKREDISPRDFQLGVQQLINIGLGIARERGFHCVSVAEFSEAPMSETFAPYITMKTDLELYFVDPAKNPVGEFSRKTPAFEMGLV